MNTADLRQRLKSSKSDSWLSVVCAGFLGLGLIATAASISSNAHVQPKVGFEKSDWKVSFSVTSTCGLAASSVPKDCPASPESALWSSDIGRESDSFLKRYSSESGGAFWMGLKIPQAKLAEAEKASATTLVLPHVNGTVQVWVDGVYQKTHDFSQQRMPLTITLPKSRLTSAKDLTIALGVFPYPHQPVPERNNDVREGFYASLDADALTRSSVFFSTSQHLIAVSLFLLIGCFLWSISSTGRSRDYAVGTQLSLLVALTTLMSVDLSFEVFSVNRYESVFFSLLLLEAFLVGRFTWTILRGNQTTSRWEMAALAACLVVPNVFSMSRWIEDVGVNFLASWILPLTYLVSAGFVVFRLRNMRYSSRMRVRFFMIAGVSFAMTAILYFVESRHQSGFHVVWARWTNLLVLMGLVRVFTKSHQTKSSLIEMAPKSKYHKMTEVPSSVEGWVLQFNVQPFSRDRQVMSTVISHLWTISRMNDGEVISADDSSLVVLFESGNSRVAAALDEMAKCVDDLERRLPIVMPVKTNLKFRAALLKGSLKPSFNIGESGTLSLPTWIDESGLLQRLREMTASQSSSEESVIVLRDEDAAHFGSISIKRAS